METEPFKIGEQLKEGWRLTKSHFAFFGGYLIISFLLSVLFKETHSTLWTLIGWIVLSLVHMGLYNSALMVTKEEKPGYNQLYANASKFVSWVLATFLFGLMVIGGFILLIVPGFYLWTRYGLYPFVVLDKNLGPIDSLQKASEISEGARWSLFLLFITCLVLNIIGLMLFGIGLLVTIPMTLIALALVYRKLSGKVAEIYQP